MAIDLVPLLRKAFLMARTKTRPVGRTPAKRRACEGWLAKQLAGSPWPARNVLEAGAKLGWGWATVRRAKANVGAQSFKKGNEWWWFDPKSYTPALASTGVVAENSTGRALNGVTERSRAIERSLKLPEGVAPVAERNEDTEVAKRPAYEIYRPDRFVESRQKPPPPVPAQAREPERPKAMEPLKPRRVRIWENEIKDARDGLIAAAGFTDLYIMRADIRLRQEQLHSKGLLKEEAALDELLLRVNEALEKKKRSENIEVE